MTSAAGFGFHQFLSPDSPARLTRLSKRALDLGIRVIATHKAIPSGPVRGRPLFGR
jgi:hypothetical protein